MAFWTVFRGFDPLLVATDEESLTLIANLAALPADRRSIQVKKATGLLGSELSDGLDDRS